MYHNYKYECRDWHGIPSPKGKRFQSDSESVFLTIESFQSQYDSGGNAIAKISGGNSSCKLKNCGSTSGWRGENNFGKTDSEQST